MKTTAQYNRITAALSLMLLCAACSNSSSNSSASSLAISGKLNVNATGSSKLTKLYEEDVRVGSLDISGDKVVCTVATTPPSTATGTVDSSGNFSVSLSNASGQPVSCIMTDAAGAKLADFLIQDSSAHDMSGNAGTYTNSAVLNSSVQLGTINYDPNAGEVTVPKANLGSALNTSAPATVASVFDPTGVWSIAAVDFSLPNGVHGPCASGSPDCHGPEVGQSLYMKLWDGIVSADSSKIYGLQLWNSQASANNCGSGSAPYVGLSAADKSSIGVDFSSHGSADAEFNFTSVILAASGFSDQANSGSTAQVNLTPRAGITEPAWRMSTAKTRYQFQSGCGMKDVTVAGITYHAYSCGPDLSSYYMFNLTGGCVDNSGKPVNVDNWSSINTCDPMVIDSNGVRTNSCRGTYNSTSVTCTNKYLVSTSSSGSPADMNSSHNFNYNDLTTVAAGTNCSSGSLSALQQLQCYADYYYASGLSEYGGACLPRISTDWTATTAANFINVDLKPSSLIFFEQFHPFPDGSGGTLMSRQTHFEGVQVGNNSWVSCQTIESGALTIRKVNSSKLLVTYQSSTVTTNVNKPACLAKFNGARDSFTFYMTK